MLTAPADIWEAACRPTIKKKLRLTWTFVDGTALDLTDRLIRVGSVDRTLRPIFNGFRTSGLGVMLWNGDDFFHPNAHGSVIGSRIPTDYLGGELLLEQAILGEVSGWYYMPVYTGIVTDMDYGGEVVELRAVDETTYLLNVPTPETLRIDPSQSASEWIQDFLMSYSALTSANIDSGSFDYAQAWQDELRWDVYGEIPKGSSLLHALEDLAHSGGGDLWTDESGIIHYDTLFPDALGDSTQAQRPLATFQQVIHAGEVRDSRFGNLGPPTASDFSFSRSTGSFVAEVAAEYMGTYASTVSFDASTLYGFTPRQTMSMPYLVPMRCADLATWLAYESYSNLIEVVKFVTHGIGLFAQINDRIPIILPGTLTYDAKIYNADAANYSHPVVHRITSVRWARDLVTIEAVKDNAISSIYSADFGIWSVTDYLDSDFPLL